MKALLGTSALAAVLAVVPFIGSCSSGAGGSSGQRTAKAMLQAKSGSNLSGVAVFTEVGDGVRVVVEVTGVSPGEHAVHLHEVGDCSSADGKSAGGHFNPDSVDHGGPHSTAHHPGDFGNMYVDADGKGRLELFTRDLTVRPGRYSVVGRGIIVHEKADDLTSQPTGAAGGRIGCGVVMLQP